MKDKGYSKSGGSGAGTVKGGNGGPTRGGKSTGVANGGKSTSGNATNVIAVCGRNPKEYSPSATSFSKNR